MSLAKSEHIKRGGTCCPVCMSPHVEWVTIETKNSCSVVQLTVLCQKCCAQWVNTYQLIDITAE